MLVVVLVLDQSAILLSDELDEPDCRDNQVRPVSLMVKHRVLEDEGRRRARGRVSKLRSLGLVRLGFRIPAATLPISPRSAFKLSFECIHCPERKFGGGVHVCNARLQLQKILPCAILVSLRIGFVAHAEDHTQKAMAW